MDFFDLPERTKVGRVVPKNAFDEYTNTKQKKLFTDCIQRITWSHKLSAATVNLEARDIQEIQIFKVELKVKSEISKILEVINKSIPYHIVFWVEYKEEAFISTALKHLHPTNENIAVIDWTFTSDWFNKDIQHYSVNLKGTLDSVFKDICVQISGNPLLFNKSMEFILENQQSIDRLRKQLVRLESDIAKCKQFNKKVEMNIKLKKIKQLLTNKNRGD